jgi:hypothetical protein
MNSLAEHDFSPEDREQFAQLIGYSLSGFGELSYVSDETYAAAELMKPGRETDHVAARLVAVETLLDDLRAKLREPIADLYGIHQDDLKG